MVTTSHFVQRSVSGQQQGSGHGAQDTLQDINISLQISLPQWVWPAPPCQSCCFVLVLNDVGESFFKGQAAVTFSLSFAILEGLPDISQERVKINLGPAPVPRELCDLFSSQRDRPAPMEM